MSTNALRIIVQIILAILVLAGGAMITKRFIDSAEGPPKKPPKAEEVLVKTIEVKAYHEPLVVKSHGTVSAAKTTILRPQVAGELTWMHPDLILGGQVKAGERLIEIEKSDYEINLAEANAGLEQAKTQLEIQRGYEAVAKREWELFEQSSAEVLGDNEGYKGLATREPQIRSALATISAAKQKVKRARLSLSRTTIDAPFNAFIQSENVEVGDILSQQTAIATLVGDDEFWIEVTVPLERLPYIALPQRDATGALIQEGSPVRIYVDNGKRSLPRQGKILRLLNQLEPAGRLARLLVSVPRPLDEQLGSKLLLGTFVQVEIVSPKQLKAVELPRAALREGDKAYVMNGEGELEIRELEISWRLEESVLVTKGLAPGDAVVSSAVGSPLPGMKLRTRERQGDETQGEQPEREKASSDD